MGIETIQGYPSVVFTGANVIVHSSVSGSPVRAGVGNLYIGDNSFSAFSPSTGTNSLVVGYGNSFSGDGQVIFGGHNTVSGNYSFVAGSTNTVTGATVLGAYMGSASGGGVVIGGATGRASGYRSVVIGAGSANADGVINIGSSFFNSSSTPNATYINGRAY